VTHAPPPTPRVDAERPPAAMTTVHFVHPRDAARNSSPLCIGNEVDDRRIGKGRKKIPGVHVLGFMDFSRPQARAKVDGSNRRPSAPRPGRNAS